MIYKLSQFSNQIIGLDGERIMSIPFDPANTDYQVFLAWCAEGNTPEPADEVTE